MITIEALSFDKAYGDKMNVWFMLKGSGYELGCAYKVLYENFNTSYLTYYPSYLKLLGMDSYSAYSLNLHDLIKIKNVLLELTGNKLEQGGNT